MGLTNKQWSRVYHMAIGFFLGGLVSWLGLPLAFLALGPPGDYILARSLFPYAMALHVLSGDLTGYVALVTACAQFPIYGILVGAYAFDLKKVFAVGGIIFGAHAVIATVCLCFPSHHFVICEEPGGVPPENPIPARIGTSLINCCYAATISFRTLRLDDLGGEDKAGPMGTWVQAASKLLSRRSTSTQAYPSRPPIRPPPTPTNSGNQYRILPPLQTCDLGVHRAVSRPRLLLRVTCVVRIPLRVVVSNYCLDNSNVSILPPSIPIPLRRCPIACVWGVLCL